MTKENKFDAINAEKQELNILIGRGISFEVDRTVNIIPKGIFGILKKKVKKTETLKFTISEPTLSTLDRISAEQIDMHLDEKIMSSEIGVQEAKKMVVQHGRRFAKIIALAVLGQDYIIQVKRGEVVRYEYDDDRLQDLTDLFFNNIKPSKLIQLTIFVNTISNLGDFTNSIRLMSASRTTMPILVEAKEKV